MAKDQYASLSDENTFEGEARIVEPADRSLGDESTFGDGGASSIADLEGLGTDVDLDMEIIDLAARYTVEGTLGKGGMGEVLLATDTRLKRKVAIKRILGPMAQSKTALNRFLTEAQSIAALSHPNIVQIYDYGRDQQGPFLIMEYVDGDSLQTRTRQGALSLKEAVELACQLCDGLGKAHEAGIIHRDIKPANVLLTVEGHPKLTDFGLARQDSADHGRTMAGAVLGTIDFMPPEQRRDATLVDTRSDLWSLAATLYQMITGKNPRVIRLDLVDVSLRTVLGTALEDAKEDRYQTARDFRDALQSSLIAQETPFEVVVDLGAGDCLRCRTKNESTRKFCRECAASLRVACLACKQEIHVSDKVCGECGAKQPELVAQKRARLNGRRARAESLYETYRYDDAIKVARQIVAVEDGRLQHQRDWADAFLVEAKAEKKRQKQLAANHFAEAKTHRDANDFHSAIHALESIPAPMRTGDMLSFLEQTKHQHEELQDLLRTIKARIKRGDLDGLFEQVNRALELQGNHDRLLKLKSQLRERRQRQKKLIRQQFDLANEDYLEAKGLLAEGKSKAALSLMTKVRNQTPEMSASQEQLIQRLQQIVNGESELTATIQAAKADGVIDPDEVWEILPKVIGCLKLNPKHASIKELKEELFARIKRHPVRHAACATNELLKMLPREVLMSFPAKALVKLPVEAFAGWPLDAVARVRPEICLKQPTVRNSIGMELKLLPAGTFMMGDSGNSHPVTVTKSFYLGIHEVTQKQYELVMGSNPSHFKGSQHPVEQVGWQDAVEFCRKLSALPDEREAGNVYRLPTEADWEYACRAGTKTEFSFGDDQLRLGNYAWYEGNNSQQSTQPVAQKQPNAWGLYDMHGNVWEWCQDWGEEKQESSRPTDPAGPSKATFFVYRGGGWNFPAGYCRSSNRLALDPSYRGNDLGFRVARDRSGQSSA